MVYIKVRETGNIRKMQRGIVRTLIDMFVLRILNEKSACSYEILKTLRQQESSYFSPSLIYPLLHDLELEGLVVSEHIALRKRNIRLYTISDKGKKTLSDMEKNFQFLIRKWRNENKTN